MNGDSWKVYYVLNCRHTTPPKNKYVITFKHSNEVYLGIFINSSITDFARRSNHIRPCIVEILEETNPYLHYDSYVNCSSVYRYTIDELVQHVGYVSEDAQMEVKKAITQCPSMKLKWKTSILDKI